MRVILCPCGNTEDMPVDEQRHHMQHFEWKANIGSEAVCTCLVCGRTVETHIYDI